MSIWWTLVTVLLLILPALSQIIPTTCKIPSVEEGDDATLTVHFGDDLIQKQDRDFRLTHLDRNDKETVMLTCDFSNGDVKCQKTPCCTWDSKVTDVFRVYIHNASQQLEGKFWGFVTPGDTTYHKYCNFTLKASTCLTVHINATNSHMTCNNQSVTIGQSCIVICNSGHSFQQNQYTLTYTCVGRSKWSPEIPDTSCEVKSSDQKANALYSLFLLFLVIPIVIAIIFVIRHQNKRKGNDSEITPLTTDQAAVRSPPVVVREVMDLEEIKDKQVHEDTVSDVTVPTDGPPVMRIEHRDGQSGHTGDWPRDCVECGHQVARVLTELDVGRTGDSNGPPPLQYRDVLVMCENYPTDDRVKGFVLETTTASGLVRGLRDRHVPVRVVKEGDKAAIRDTALGVGDLVTVANWRDVQDLERKVVVVEKRFNLFERLLPMSRCTTQLVLIEYLFVPFSTVHIAIEFNCQSPCYSQIMTIANTTGIVLTAN